jgi:hypothetical protein
MREWRVVWCMDSSSQFKILLRDLEPGHHNIIHLRVVPQGVIRCHPEDLQPPVLVLPYGKRYQLVIRVREP